MPCCCRQQPSPAGITCPAVDFNGTSNPLAASDVEFTFRAQPPLRLSDLL
jgi:hypothetical protein